MESDTLRMFGCPVCGFRITDTDHACPRCSSTFDEETKFECPFCGEMVDPKAKSCPFCHVDYDEFRSKSKKGSDANIDELLNEIISLESVQVKQDLKKFSCPDCSWLLDGTEEKCPKCGRDLSDEFAFQCPICGATVSHDAISCQECGAKFETEEGPSEPAEIPPALGELEELAASARASRAVEEPTNGREGPDKVEEPPVAPAPKPVEAEAPEPPQRAPETGGGPAPEKPAPKKTRKRKLKVKPSR